jgi:hypothetical protein
MFQAIYFLLLRIEGSTCLFQIFCYYKCLFFWICFIFSVNKFTTELFSFTWLAFSRQSTLSLNWFSRTRLASRLFLAATLFFRRRSQYFPSRLELVPNSRRLVLTSDPSSCKLLLPEPYRSWHSSLWLEDGTVFDVGQMKPDIWSTWYFILNEIIFQSKRMTAFDYSLLIHEFVKNLFLSLMKKIWFPFISIFNWFLQC